MYLFKLHFCPDRCPGVGLLHHIDANNFNISLSSPGLLRKCATKSYNVFEVKFHVLSLGIYLLIA